MADTVRGVWLALQRGWGAMHSELSRFHEGVYQRLYSPDSAMDSLATLLFGWIIFSLMCFFFGSYLHGRYLKPKPKDEQERKEEEERKKKKSEKKESEAPEVTEPQSATAEVSHEVPLPPVIIEEKSVTKEVLEGSEGPPIVPSVAIRPVDAGIEAKTPKAIGSDPDSVQWVNSVLRWLYVNPNFAKDIYHTWLGAINEFTARIAAEYEVEVEVYPEEEPSTSVPSLSNIFTDFASTDNITVTCDFAIEMELSVMAKRLDEEECPRVCLSILVEQLRGRLNTAFLTEDLLAVMKFDGWPEVKLSVDGGRAEDEEEQYLQDAVCDILTASFRNTVLDLSINKYPTFPRFVRSKAVTEPLMGSHVQYDTMLQGSLRLDPHTDKRLLVKVVKASNLGQSKGCAKPCCVIEMDEPPQKHTTSVKPDTTNPFWDETFLFDLSQGTAEVLFELYDRSKMDENFLGLGIVGIEELLVTPSQRQIIPLQSRPYENDPVSGSLTVEFLFMEGVELPMNEGPLVTTETTLSMSPSGQLITNTKTTIAHTGDFLEQIDRDSITDAALNAIGNTSVPGANPSKSTLVIQGVQKDGESSIGDADSLMNKPHEQPPVPPDFEYEDDGEKHTMIIHSKPKPEEERTTVKVVQDALGGWHEVSQQEYDRTLKNHSEAPAVPSVSSSLSKEDERGRSRKKKRTFFGSIRRKIREMRSRSMEPGRSSSRERSDTGTRSASQDRARSMPVDDQQTFLLVPGARSRHSSMSEMSNISGASSRTFIDESSTLVLETTENGVKKYYLIPIHLAHSTSLKKKGTKLHVYNDHIFIAKHLASGILCSVCKNAIPRRPGKQGYQCRDCHVISHKECHIRIEDACPNSTLQVLELQIMKGYPPLPTPQSSSTLPRQKRSRSRRGNNSSKRTPASNTANNGYIPSANGTVTEQPSKKKSIFKKPSLLRKSSWRKKLEEREDKKVKNENKSVSPESKKKKEAPPPPVSPKKEQSLTKFPAIQESPKKVDDTPDGPVKDKSRKKSSGIFRRSSFFRKSPPSPPKKDNVKTNADTNVDLGKSNAEPVMTKNETNTPSPAKVVNIDKEESKKKRRFKDLFRRPSLKFGKPDSPKLLVTLPTDDTGKSAHKHKLNTEIKAGV